MVTEGLSLGMRVFLMLISAVALIASAWNLCQAQRDVIASNYSDDLSVKYAAKGLRNTQRAFVVISGFSLLAWTCTIIRFIINPVELETSVTFGALLTTTFLIPPQVAVMWRSIQGNLQRIKYNRDYQSAAEAKRST